jgi:ABC-2 type transport system permease protein
MFAKIVRFEWKHLKADSVAWIVLALFLLSIAYAFFASGKIVAGRRTSLEANRLSETERYRKNEEIVRNYEIRKANGKLTDADSWGPWFPVATGDYDGSRIISQPPAPFAVLAQGQSDLFPNSYKINTRIRETFIGSEELVNPLKLLVGYFDPAFVILYLYPLVILAVSFNLLSFEKENGTLAMLASQPVRLRSLVSGKILTRAILIFVPVLMFSVIAMISSGVDWAADGSLLRLAVLALLILLYGAFWFGLAVLINAFGKSSATNAMILATCWLGWVVLIPTLINLAAVVLFPVPSRIEFVNASRIETQEAREKGSALLGKFLEDHPDLVEASKNEEAEYYVLRAARDLEVAKNLEPVLDRYNRQLENQHNLVNRMRFLSPAVTTHGVLIEIAGAGISRYKHFLSQVDQFHKDWQAFFVPKYYSGSMMSSVDFRSIPEFRYVEESASALLPRVAIPLVTLAAVNLLILMMGLWLYRSYPVTG